MLVVCFLCQLCVQTSLVFDFRNSFHRRSIIQSTWSWVYFEHWEIQLDNREIRPSDWTDQSTEKQLSFDNPGCTWGCVQCSSRRTHSIRSSHILHFKNSYPRRRVLFKQTVHNLVFTFFYASDKSKLRRNVALFWCFVLPRYSSDLKFFMEGDSGLVNRRVHMVLGGQQTPLIFVSTHCQG